MSMILDRTRRRLTTEVQSLDSLFRAGNSVNSAAGLGLLRFATLSFSDETDFVEKIDLKQENGLC